jgi:alkanesulfonate monooxygenase SsuD/methylene tetrahydromethanopterin reductase-like flavin-dependent oxidoreductase (luciferase family)
MVSYRSSDGKQSYHQTDELSDAMQYVEHLRNAEGVEHARIFKLEELSFEYRPYYRVELASVLPPPPAAPIESDWLSPTPEVAETPAEDADPLAAAWSVSERPEPVDGESVGAGMGRKGLFGR